MRAVLMVWAVLLTACAVATADDLTPERRKELEKKAEDANKQGAEQFQRGAFVKAGESLREALAIMRVLYPREQFPKGHAELVSNISNLAILYKTLGDYDKAEPLYREARDMCQTLYPREQFPQGHPQLAASINGLGSLHYAAGEYRQAETLFRQALAMRRALYPKKDYPHGHPALIQSINYLAGLDLSKGEYGQAESLFREALDMKRGLYPPQQFPHGHADLALALNNLAGLYKTTGEYGRAESLFREALDMYRGAFPKEQFPRGHPDLARSINNLGLLYQDMKRYGQAEPLLRESLEMRRALFPKEKFPRGHPTVALALHNLAMLHQDAEEFGRAEPLFREALDMCRVFYAKERFPRGHPHLLQCANSLGLLYKSMGEYDKAEPLLREALEMSRALYPRQQYPQGHPDVIWSLTNLAGLRQAAGQPGKAEPLLREALEMQQDLLRRFADLAAEAECLNYLSGQSAIRDGLLSVTRQVPAAPPVYEAVWNSRAPLMRLQEQHHRALMADRDPASADLSDQLGRARAALARALLSPGRDPDQRRALVDQLTRTKEDLEKRINARLKLSPLPSALPPPAKRLGEVLPQGTAFVDISRYTDFGQDPKVKGSKGEKRTDRYVAFIVRRGKPVARVELGEAAPVERAWAAWREAITAARPDEATERTAAAALAKLVWEPLRKELPAAPKTVYLTPDGVLHQVPWAALPGAKPGTVLLDEHAVCLVPHGSFLLERLEGATSGAASAGTLLAVGGVDYDGAPEAARVKGQEVALRAAALGDRVRWPALPGTDAERRQVAQLARRVAHIDVVECSGKTASTEHLQHDLPGARYAHIATHGFFADPKLRSALQLDPQEFERASPDRRGGGRSPLAMSGLVFAGANRAGRDMAEDRGILTAEGLIGLRLEGMELAVLSACETGLGDWGGGEGVYGLQRAFHVAGCRNVIASLWKVDDGATQALMALFYRNLWEKKLDPAEALRRAQLTLYRHPEAVAVAQKRGADFSESDLPKAIAKPAEKPKHSPTAHWAAFTFSGVRPTP